MFLAKDEYFQINRVLLAFKNQQPTYIHHHSNTCCFLARSWFLGMDKSSLLLQSASFMPIWIREHFRWGPSAHPIYWCQSITSETLDCGALAALTRESLCTRSILALPAQLIVKVTEQDCVHWSRMWQGKGFSCNWIRSPFIYHEVCAVLSELGNKIRIWDPSNNCWVEPSQVSGYWRPVALRVEAEYTTIMQWGNIEVRANEWTILKRPNDRNAG